jgi:endonuclease III
VAKVPTVAKAPSFRLLTARQVAKVTDALAAHWPNARCELVYRTPFQLLLAVVLSAQTTDKAVNKALAPLFEKNPLFGPANVVKLGVEGFLKHIKSIGLAPTKAKNCVALSQKILKESAGEVPHSRDFLESLPGVGRKTANVVLNEVFGEPTIAVDTHLARLSVRIGFSGHSEKREKIEEDLLEKIPKKHLLRIHHYLIFQGRYVCMARRPLCNECPLTHLCPKNGVEL